MAITYKLYQNKNDKSTAFEKYYGRLVTAQTISTGELSKMIQENVSVKESDVYAVLKELKNAVRNSFMQGNAVRIEGLGIFRPSASSVGVKNPNDFTADNFTKLRIVFRPETIARRVSLTRTVGNQTVTIQTRIYDKKLLDGLSFVESADYNSPRVKDVPETSGSGQGSTNP